jgi:hypothetical protein
MTGKGIESQGVGTMRQVFNIVLGLVALLALGAVTIGVTQLNTMGSAPDTQNTATPTPSPGTETATSSTSVPPRVAPNPFTISGEKFWPELVIYKPTFLTMWSIDPVTKTLRADGSFILSWTRATGPNGSTNLTFTLATAETFSTSAVFTSSVPSTATVTVPFCDQTLYPPTMRDGPQAICYRANATDARLNVGEYQATLFVSDGISAETQVPITVLVGRPLWFLVMAVAGGVIVTEIWWYWRKSGRFKLAWFQRRSNWLDWLSKNQQWTRYQGANQNISEREALRAVQFDLRAQLKPIDEWLIQGRAGQLAIADLPAAPDAIALFTDPLRDAGWRYLVPGTPDRPGGITAEQWNTSVSEVYTELTEVIAEAAAEAEAKRHKAHKALYEVYSAYYKPAGSYYTALSALWNGATPPTDKTLAAAWSAAQVIWTRFDTSKNLVTQLPAPQASNAAAIAHCIAALTAHVDALRQDVVLGAQAQSGIVKSLSHVHGKLETLAFYEVMSAIDMKTVEQLLSRAEYPLMFAEPGTAVANSADQLKQLLDSLNVQVGRLTCNDLNDDAIQAMMLVHVQQTLGDIDTKLANPSIILPAIWDEVVVTYGSQERVVKLGRQIARLQEKQGANDPAFALRLRQAYQYLLNGRILDAEIQVEKVKSAIAKKQELKLKRLFAPIEVRLGLHRTRAAMAGDRPQPQRRLRPLLITVALILSALGCIFVVYTNSTLISAPQLIPTPTPEPSTSVPKECSTYYQVQWGNSLSGIAWYFGTTIQALQAANPQITNPNLMYTGMVLCIPGRAQISPVEVIVSFITGPLATFVVITLVLVVAFMFARLVLASRRGSFSFRLYVSEKFGSVLIGLTQFVATLMWLLVSLTIAVTIIIAAREVVLKNSLSTWGTDLDILVAFTWGAVAHRILQSLQSNFGAVEQWMKGEKSE